MPFGLLFGAVVMGGLGLLMGLALLLQPWLPGTVAGATLALVGPVLAVGLLLRQDWARRFGIAAAAWMAGLGFVYVLERGSVFDHVALLAPLLAAVLLIVPATGGVRRGLADGREPRRLGSFPPALAAVGLAILVAATVWGAADDRSPVRLGRVSAATGFAVSWLGFDEGLERARAGGKPALVDFYATWCGPCIQMDRTTFRDAAVVARLTEDFVPIRVDVDRQTDLAERYFIGTYPTMVLVDGDGKEISRRTGGVGARGLLEWLESVMPAVPATGPVARSRP